MSYPCPEMPKRLPGETQDEWIIRACGPFPDTEYDQSKDLRSLNLPVSGSREDRESLGDYDYNNQPIRRMK